MPFTPFLPELYTVTARALDGAGNEGTLGTTFTATGDPDLEPPVVSLSIVPDTVAQGGTVQITVSATDNINVDSLTLEINSTPVPIPPSGIVDFVAPAIAIYNVVARAEDPTGNFDEETGSFEAIDPATDTTDPTVAITTPGDGDEALGLVDIIGTADDPRVAGVEIGEAARSRGREVEGVGLQGRVVGGLLGTLDTSLLPNGLIDIRLRATDANSNVSQTTTVSVSGENKPGVFQLSVVDLQVPVSGIPISIIRSYDSRTRGTSQDFGHGWKVEVVQSATYQFNRLPGASWSTPIGSLLGGGFCPPGNETAFHIIEIRVSDTEFYQFRPTLDTGVFTTLPVTYPGSMNFTQIGGVPGASLEILHFNQFFYVPGDPDLTYPIDHPTLGGQVFTPRDVRLTTLQGKVLDVNLTDGLQRVADANGNALVINSSGVTHSSGKSVTFVRDGSGRITSITDPLGNARTYAYDANGDLTSATDCDSNTTLYFYEDAPHFLTRIQDPEGNDTLTNEYDADGRLIAKTDSEGEKTEIAYDLANNGATLTAPNNDEIQLFYGDRGHVVQASGGGNTFSATYDARGNLLTRTDPLGHTTTYTYDANDNLTSREDHLGNRVETTYDANGRPLTNTDANGFVTAFTYDGSGNLLTRTQAVGVLDYLTTFTYDANGNKLTETDARGFTTAFTYDADGNMLTRTRDPGGLNLLTTFTYDANGNELTETNPRGFVTTFTYDNRGNVLTRTEATGVLDILTTFAYDSNGRVISETDPNGNTTQTTYDGRGAVTRIDYEDTTFEVFGYDEKGRRTGATDRLLRTTFYGYDRENRLVTVRDPANGEVTRTYDAAGRTISEEDALGRVTTYTYDAADRRIASVNHLTHATTFTYTPSGRVKTETDPLLNTTTYTYDELDRLVRTDFPDLTNTQVEYDAVGNRTAEVDQAGGRTEYEYDAAGRLIKVTDPLLNETTCAYDANGNLISQTDANTNTTTYTYDAVDRRITVQRPLLMTATTAYDDNGNVLSQTDFNGDTTTFTYDSNDRMLTRTLPGPVVETFTYDAVGNRETATDARGVTTWTYDLLDRLTQRTDPDTTVVQYEYDLVGNRTALVSPAGRTEYAYDALNRLVTVTAPDLSVTTYTYDAANNLDSIARPDGTTTTYTQDLLGRLTGISTEDSTTAIIASYTCTLDTRGNRTQVIDGHTGRTVDYTYDALSRLTQEQITGADAETITYTYDAVGNRLTRISSVVGATTYAYDDNDSLLNENAGAITYGYDNNGNVVQRVSGGTTVDYTYDGLNRLVQVDDGTTAVDYTYDVDANRVHRIVSGGGTINFLIDANRTFAQVIRETDGGGTGLATYIHGLDLLCQDRGGGTSYYHYDPQTSTRQLTNAGGVVTDTYDYDAFGVPRTTTGTTVNDHRYAGEHNDPLGDLVYLRARWMLPSVGRFLSEDPADALLTDPRTLNRYVYALNNPVNRIDPSGEFSLAGMMTAVSISKILVTIAPAITTGLATIAIINAFWEPGFELRNAGLLIMSSTTNSILTELAYRMYVGGTALIELGAVLIDLTRTLIDLTFAFAGLASSINSLVNSVNAIQAIARGLLLANTIFSLASKVNALSQSMQNLGNTLGANSQGASPPPAAQLEANTIKSVAKEIVKLALQIAAAIE